MLFRAVLTLLYLVPPLLALNPQNLVGKWINDEGLFLTVSNAADGQLSGIYETTKGTEMRQYVFSGSYDTSQEGRTLGWTVSWNNVLYGSSHSNSVWAGTYVPQQDKEPAKIETTWIHISDSRPEDRWQSTLIGKTEFLHYDEREKPEISIP